MEVTTQPIFGLLFLEGFLKMINTVIASAKNLTWTSPDSDRFDAEVLFQGHQNYIPTACNIVEVGVLGHITDLWNRAMNGEFGQIAEFVPPPEIPERAQATATGASGEIPGSVL